MIRAFTLIEVLVVLALTATLIAATSYVYAEYNKAYPFVEASLEVTGGASAIVEEVREAGLQATRFVGTHTFSGTLRTSSATTTIFELPAINASGATIAGSYDYIGVYASGTAAYRTIDAASASVRASGTKKLTAVLQNLLFTYDNSSIPQATSVVVEATTTATVRGEATEAHVRTKVYLRNL